MKLDIDISRQHAGADAALDGYPVQPRRQLVFSETVFNGCVRILDVAAVVLAFAGTYFAYLSNQPYVQLELYEVAVAVVVLLAVNFFSAAGIYDTEKLERFDFQFRRMAFLWTCAVTCLILGLFVLKVSDYYSRVWIVTFYFAGLASLGLVRLSAAHLLRRWLREGALARHICVLGAGPLAQRFVERVNDNTSQFRRVVGIFDDRRSRVPRSVGNIQVMGTTADLVAYARSRPVDEIVIALPLSAEARLMELVNKLGSLPIDIRVLTDFAGFQLPNRTVSHVSGVPVIHLLDKPIKEWGSMAKAIEDFVLAAIFCAVLAPAMLIVACLIKLDSRGPVLFRQQRYGFNNQLFSIFKFRTLHTALSDPNADKLTTKNDPRITRVGRILRKYSLDELPQLFNVLNGTMSIVGPRPHAINAKADGTFYQNVVNNYAARHRVKPGITGWAQVNGWRGETNTREKIEKRVEHDVYYIDNWSIGLDLWIIGLTLVNGIVDRNA